MKCPCDWFNDSRKELLSDIGRLLLRLYFGGAMFLAHGWGKLAAFMDRKDSFPDPLGVGSPVSLSLTIFAEVACAILLVFGVLTRLSTVPLMFAMGVAFFVIHGNDAFQRRELALVYLFGYIIILLMGPGRFSLDRVIWGKPPETELPATKDRKFL